MSEITKFYALHDDKLTKPEEEFSFSGVFNEEDEYLTEISKETFDKLGVKFSVVPIWISHDRFDGSIQMWTYRSNLLEISGIFQLESVARHAVDCWNKDKNFDGNYVVTSIWVSKKEPRLYTTDYSRKVEQ